MQVMEAGDVIGNDKVVGVCVRMGGERGGGGSCGVLCVPETCWGTVIECVSVSVFKTARR